MSFRGHQSSEEILPRNVSVENIDKLLLSINSTASTAPTHTPRNLYEQIVVKDSGSVSALWVWSKVNGWYRV